MVWQKIAARMISGLNVQPGEFILVLDQAGQPEMLSAAVLEIELAGATPLPQLAAPDYMERLWQSAPETYLRAWDTHRTAWYERLDRILVLGGARPNIEAMPQERFALWEAASSRLEAIEETHKLPFLYAAVPTQRHAESLGMTLGEFERIVLPALEVSIHDLQAVIRSVLDKATNARTLTIKTGNGHELTLKLGDRTWKSDDGYIDEVDRQNGAIVSNLPAGSIYTTVLEDQTSGEIYLPKAGSARDVILRFESGRIVDIHAGENADALEKLFARHMGEARRVGHIGIGLNPALDAPIGWTLVDEHVAGYLFLSLGENRYMGGENESSLNIDFAVPDATLLADEFPIVQAGKLLK